MQKYKLREGEVRLLVAVFEHLKPYYEQTKANHTGVADEMFTEKILEIYYELLERALVINLTTYERIIIKYRYGLSENSKLHTLEETAREFNVSRERMRRLEAKALSKIEQYMTELNDEETAIAINLLDAKAQEHVSEDVSMRNWMVCTVTRNKLAIQQDIRRFKEQR